MNEFFPEEAEHRPKRVAQGRAIRGLLFDKDGTLFDFHGTWSEWSLHLIETLAEGDAARRESLAAVLGYDLQARRFEKSSPVIAGTLDVVVEAVVRVLPDVRPNDLRDYLVRSAAAVQPVPAVPLAPLLDALRARGLALGVATNDAEASALSQLVEAGVSDRFDFVAGYDTGYGGKPGPGMNMAFGQAVRLAPEEVAMVGDSTHDLHAARAAGNVAVAVLTGPAEAADLEPHADIVLRDIGALLDWLGPGPEGGSDT